jgi:archaellum biogenesis ATPase FlaH
MAQELEYNKQLQELFVKFLASDTELFTRCQSITRKEFFDNHLQEIVEFLDEHVSVYQVLPTREQLIGIYDFDWHDILDAKEQHKKWFIEEYEKFCRHKALALAILESTDLLQEDKYGEVERIIKEAVQLGLPKNMGTQYFEDPRSRLEKIKDNNGTTSTGWQSFDRVLYGGFNRGELNIFAGGSGAGKSLFLQNLALNWALAGINVVYVSLELSEGLCSMRMDSMLTGYGTKDIFKNMDDVELNVKMKGKKSGNLQIIQMPNGVTINDIRSYLKELETKSGKKTQAILVDYLDLMMPAQRKVPPSDLFIKDKFVSEELRNLATELEIVMATASQLNRGAVDEVEFDHSHIAGGLSKIQTADNVVGIFSSKLMRERGRMQIQFMKTRSSSGVGSKLDLKFDVNSLKISDLDEDEAEEKPESIYESIKRKTETSVKEAPKLDPVDHSERLKNLLRKMN